MIFNKTKILKKTDIMSFGKYKGKKIEYIIYVDPKYMDWLLTETNISKWFKLNKSALRFFYIELAKTGLAIRKSR